jgi:small subunit ribosomal protein S13
MPRLLGVEIPADKRIEASLTYIYGVGPSTARRVLEQTNIDPNLRAKELSPQQINEIILMITHN